MTNLADDTVISALAAGADRFGDDPFLRIGGHEISYGQAHESVAAVAAALVEFGVSAGDRVTVMTENCQEAVWAWLGANAASAIDVPLNTAAHGAFLEGQLAAAGPRVVVGTSDYLARMADVHLPGLELAVTIGEPVEVGFGSSVRQVSFDELLSLGRTTSQRGPSRPDSSAPATIMFTSGTTGPSKGVMIPQRYYSVWGRRSASYLDVKPGEVTYCVQPLFHVDARAYVLNAVFCGATSAIGSRFSVSRFWDEIRDHRANVFSYIGTMLWLLYKQPESDLDRQHDVRIAGGAATPAEIHRAFEQRFGIELREAYGMTESLFLAHADNATPVGSVGRLVPEIDGRLVDDDGSEVPPGSAGELIIRPTTPNCTALGYWPGTSSAAETSSEEWFHTGDLLREDASGSLYFAGRKKDSIRRRGENVSAWEVEEAAMKQPDVLEAAAIGIPSPLGEEDVALLVKVKDGSPVEPQQLREFVAQQLPSFAVPRYIEFVDSFPKTPSERVDKGKVRAVGLSEAAWDADAAPADGSGRSGS
jgi:crotonobetaine/carnitine-CoA ligase